MERPSLADILQAVLDHFGITADEWETLKGSRIEKAVKVRRAVAHIASDCWYSYTDVSKLLNVTRSSVDFHARVSRDFSGTYAAHREEIAEIKRKIFGKGKHQLKGWLARMHKGILIISREEPEKIGDFWIAEGGRILGIQDAFPEITDENSPRKIKITIELDTDGNN